ncbi:MAG: pimeloyl-ACP methyl ester carboxylesterase [Oceanospirillaceae bacterium]|jgi:pimeloyl-ACP methyl ester carboxylesterase
MKDIYFEPVVSKPNIRKKVIHQLTHFLTLCSPFLSVKLANKLLGNPFSRRTYQMRTQVAPVTTMVSTNVGNVCLHKFSISVSDPQKNIFLCHGWGDSSTRFTQLIDYLLTENFTVWSLDQVGHGQSKGNYSDLYCFKEGTTKALQYLESIQASPIALVGHSMGALGLMNVDKKERLNKQLILISAPVLFFENMQNAVASVGIAKSMLDNLLEHVSAKYQLSWQDLAPAKRIANIDDGVLIIHDTSDLICPYSLTKNLVALVPHELFTTHNLGHIKLLKDSRLMAKVVSYALQGAVKND